MTFIAPTTVDVPPARMFVKQFTDQTLISTSATSEFPEHSAFGPWRHKVDLTEYTQFRWHFVVRSTGGNNTVELQYSTTYSGVSDLPLDGGTGAQINVSATGEKDTGWLDIDASAIADDLYLWVFTNGSITANFRVTQMTVEFRSGAS